MRQAREEQEVRLAVERGMPVIPFIPVWEELVSKRERGATLSFEKCNSKSLESIIGLAKEELNPSSFEEPIYMDMGGRTQSSAPAYPLLSSIQPCYTNYMHMEVLQDTLREDFLDINRVNKVLIATL